MVVDNRLAYLTDITGGIDSGATVPVSPTAGDLFYHTPTGRKVMLQYDGSNWIPLWSIGTMTVYVDGGSGTDTIDNGGATGASAFATLQYAVDQIPATYSGDVYIYLASGNYTEDVIVRGKKASGDYAIYIEGAKNTVATITDITSAVTGTGATKGSITKTSAGWSASAFEEYFLYGNGGANDGLYYLIYANTTDTITIVGTFDVAPVANDDFIVYALLSSVYSIVGYGVKLVVSFMSFTGGSTYAWGLSSDENADVSSFYNTFSTSGGSQHVLVADLSAITVTKCTLKGSSTLGVKANNLATARINTCWFRSAGVGGGNIGVYSLSGSAVNIRSGCIISYYVKGISCDSNGSVALSTGAGGGYHVISNCTTGVYAETAGVVLGTTNNQYSSNGTDENAVSASYGYID